MKISSKCYVEKEMLLFWQNNTVFVKSQIKFVLKYLVFHKKFNKKVNKQSIRNSENWLFDDVSKIYVSTFLQLEVEKNQFDSITTNIQSFLIILLVFLKYWKYEIISMDQKLDDKNPYDSYWLAKRRAINECTFDIVNPFE